MNVLLALTGLFAFLQLSQACPMVYMPVCGTDGHTYANECFMKTHARLHNLTLAVARQGKCVPKTEDICGFPFETGPCKAAFPRWFYDVKTGKCSQFIYGGCDGNKNNFETLEECEKKCDSDKTAEYPCFRSLQKLLTEQALLVQGEPVLAHKDNHLPECDKEGYFTPKQCDKSTGECWCVNRLGKEMLNTRKKGQDVSCEVCSLPKVVGPCRAAIRRWSFDKASGKCDNFIYGGCQGNANNFEREEKCQAMCLPQELHKEKVPTRCEKEFLEATHEPLLGKFTPRCNPDGSYHLTQCHTSTGFCWCSHPDGTKYPGTEVRARPDCDKYRSLPDVTTLLAASPAQTKCQKELLEATQMPLFGRFKPRCDSDGSYSLLQCHISTGYCWCSKPDGTKYPGTEIRGKPDCDKFKITPEVKSLFASLPAPASEDICGLASETGPCKAAFQRWFYDVKTGKCSQFIYGGCDGNRNNFGTLEDCEKKCDSKKTAEYPCFRTLQKLLTKQSILIHGEPASVHKNNHLPQCDKEGYFTPKQCDKSTGECWCVNRLGKEMLNTRRKGQDVSCDVCSLPKVVGPCMAAFRRWFFNKASGKCEQFIYGGCQGNENNFQGKEQCQAMCLPHKLRFQKVPSKCQQEVLKATQNHLLGGFTPRCNPDGSYNLIQCHTSTGFCWCSHPDGTRYSGTEVRRTPNCENYKSLPQVTSLLATEADVCSLPKVVGPCYAAIPRWFFDKASRKCKQFLYGGCQGNANNFAIKEECQSKCLPKKPSVLKDKSPIVASKQEEVVEASYQEKQATDTKYTSPRTSGNLPTVLAVSVCAALCILGVVVVLVVRKRRGNVAYNKLLNSTFEPIAGEKQPLINA